MYANIVTCLLQNIPPYDVSGSLTIKCRVDACFKSSNRGVGQQLLIAAKNAKKYSKAKLCITIYNMMHNSHLQDVKCLQWDCNPEIEMKMWADMYVNIMTCLLQNTPLYNVC